MVYLNRLVCLLVAFLLVVPLWSQSTSSDELTKRKSLELLLIEYKNLANSLNQQSQDLMTQLASSKQDTERLAKQYQDLLETYNALVKSYNEITELSKTLGQQSLLLQSQLESLGQDLKNLQAQVVVLGKLVTDLIPQMKSLTDLSTQILKENEALRTGVYVVGGVAVSILVIEVIRLFTGK